jgi:hypothetical protein
MSQSAKAKVDEPLATESNRLLVHKIHKIRAAIEVLVYGAENVTTSPQRQFQVRLTVPDERQPNGQSLIATG